MYRAGLIGLTGIGARRHSADLTRPLTTLMPGSHAGAYALHPGIELVGVCDIRPEAREQFRADWSDVWPEVHCCSDYRELLGLGLDFLSVCTPDHLHAQMVVDACAHPVKGILCEKPLATTLFDADRMIEASEASGVPMQVDHTRRWRSIYQHARERIRAGEIGELRTIHASMGGPRAMLFRNGTHLIDMIVFFAEDDPEWVFAELEPGFEQYGVYAGDGGRDPAREPAVQGYIHFRQGIRALVDIHKQASYPFTLELVGSRGSMSLADTTHLEIQKEGSRTRVSPPLWTVSEIPGALAELVRHVEGSCPTLSSPPREARKTVRIMLGFLESQVRGNCRVAV